MKKSIVALMVIACLALGGITLVLGFSEDKKAPEIQFQDNEITFTQEDDYAGLLQGVTATDNRDGDVTKSLVVESVYPNDDGETATVVYVARDKTNNIGKANKVINYQYSEGKAEETSAKGESVTEQEGVCERRKRDRTGRRFSGAAYTGVSGYSNAGGNNGK